MNLRGFYLVVSALFRTFVIGSYSSENADECFI
jgi:hypothetical protein